MAHLGERVGNENRNVKSDDPRLKAITMDEFVARAHGTLERFAEATRKRAEVDPSMNPDRRRIEAWWWRDVGAYLDFLVMESFGTPPPPDAVSDLTH